MPKPPTAERGRRQPAPPPPRPPERRRLRRRPVETPAAFDAVISRRPAVATVLCVLGLAVASYLTYIHYTTSATVACLAIRGINCEKVITSPQSVVFGIPVAVLGLLFFVPMLALCVPAAWRSPRRWVAPVRLAAAVTGVGFICYLVYAELFEIRAICLWCSTVHLLTFLLFVTIATGWDDALDLRDGAMESEPS